ncbi:MAG: M48 family metallopeptidase [Candidatus Shapirobacteria bacterium]
MKNILNVYEQVERNKRRSYLVMLLFVTFLSLFFLGLGQILQTEMSLIGAAVALSLLSAFSSYWWGDKIVLALSGAEKAKKEDYFDFYTVAQNLSIASQIPMPSLYVIKSGNMNAFATGRDPDHAIICATTGLLKNLDRTELEGVVAHEFSHILDYDIRLMTIVAVLVGTITLLSDWILRTSSLSSKEDKRSNPLVMIVGFLGLILTPLAGKLIQLALSRSREYLADAQAAKLTRQPRGLISALKKLKFQTQSLKTAHAATAHLFIVNPFGAKTSALARLATLFSTHPPLDDRINELKKMI